MFEMTDNMETPREKPLLEKIYFEKMINDLCASQEGRENLIKASEIFYRESDQKTLDVKTKIENAQIVDLSGVKVPYYEVDIEPEKLDEFLHNPIDEKKTHSLGFAFLSTFNTMQRYLVENNQTAIHDVMKHFFLLIKTAMDNLGQQNVHGLLEVSMFLSHYQSNECKYALLVSSKGGKQHLMKL